MNRKRLGWMRRAGAWTAAWSAVAAVLLGTGAACAMPSEDPVALPAPLADEAPAGRTIEKAVFSGGCFWGVQKVFQHIKGVQRAVSGYAGGGAGTANYDTVSGGSTGHAESVEVTFNPAVVSFGKLLQVFFSVAHNPTEVDRQGPDHGTQYRSEVFTTNDEQKRVAEAYIRQLDQAGIFGRRIATRVEPLPGFYAAEDYHQDYATLHPDSRYIAIYDLPKVRNLEQFFPQLYRADPVLVATSGAGH